MDVAAQDDGTLVRAIAAGGACDAEAELCRRFGARVRLYGLRHLRDAHRADDLAQAALVTTLVAARAGRIEDPERVDRYVLGVCRNVARRMRETDARALPVDPVEFDLRAAIPAFQSLDARALSECLSRLAPRAFMIVTLSFQAEVPAAEIAERFGTNAANVRVARHRALAQLRDCLEHTEESSS